MLIFRNIIKEFYFDQCYINDENGEAYQVSKPEKPSCFPLAGAAGKQKNKIAKKSGKDS